MGVGGLVLLVVEGLELLAVEGLAWLARLAEEVHGSILAEGRGQTRLIEQEGKVELAA